MNLYILVEGKSEKYIYPAWLKQLLPDLIQVNNHNEVENQNYYLFSCQGYPSILDDIGNAIDDIKLSNKYDYLMVILDADDVAVDDRRAEVLNEVKKHNFDLSKILVVVQNHCIETWCLGNQRVYSRNPTTIEFINCADFYCVRENDPEFMGLDGNVTQISTTATYHEYYLSKMLLERNTSYSKGKRSKAVQDPGYLSQMLQRIDSTTHLNSFREFISIIGGLSQEIRTRKMTAASEN
ncbi:hypothetical protein A8709_25845 [Paenibacillus pectinilyticus]|uniref:DUF4276 family protein n=1 Tax=Paenibacillus pectinilyticus TaxID=512399 RepID=A0A1C1A150_9BACL|nr:hypothetical protein [Paenibacillus pectinilyticus]OCT14255.1 hypothetical protein A8709_25845 [Paenibacillus pectinilyticus]